MLDSLAIQGGGVPSVSGRGEMPCRMSGGVVYSCFDDCLFGELCMKTQRGFGLWVALVSFWILFALSGEAHAQGLAKTLYKDKINGFKFRPPSKFDIVPAREGLQAYGILCFMDSELKESEASVYVLQLDDDSGHEGGPYQAKKTKKEKGESAVLAKRPKLTDYLALQFSDRFRPSRTQIDKDFKVKGVQGRHRQWRIGAHVVDAFSYPGPSADVHLLYFVAERFTGERAGRKWLKMQSKSGRSFERTALANEVDPSSMDYADLVKYHKVKDAQYKNWRIVPTPSKKYIIKTSSKRGAFIKNAITRLERSRKLFEKDFPPAKFGQELTAVSVVRICDTPEEFHKYGGTRRGVAGWFNPSTEELVLYSGVKDKQRDALTYGVMSHEAFHQYCHFLFQRSEAHRWFDEGHGDYYAGASWYKGKAYVKPEAESNDINRLPEAKRMVDVGDMVSLRKHLNFTHIQWQSQGPKNISCYAQSWSIVYMLRQGALGKVPKQYWQKEWGNVIPNYMDTLLKGYADEYAVILAEREADAKDEKRELKEEERNIDRSDLKTSQRNQVWEDAMKASWGEVDLDEFEEKWLDYIANGLKAKKK
ncbi:MAG: hypothetical protein ACI87O_000010 [Planctomycetota bacterium]|jgi:hypothetical protein